MKELTKLESQQALAQKRVDAYYKNQNMDKFYSNDADNQLKTMMLSKSHNLKNQNSQTNVHLVTKRLTQLFRSNH